jgi:hypothetical protein
MRDHQTSWPVSTKECRASAKELNEKFDETQVDLGSKDVHRYVNREYQGRHKGSKEGLL